MELLQILWQKLLDAVKRDERYSERQRAAEDALGKAWGPLGERHSETGVAWYAQPTASVYHGRFARSAVTTHICRGHLQLR